ncbi:hypothetical protein OH782_41475 (plasmid) [Streptomyces sp. NBC_01544]|uniref:hypothetical protein n=1 Tax=Streptomyces sp. NBC_01544 TaxID=2975871 RepID=UPI002F909451
MSLEPRTVYVVGCDTCGATYYAPCADNEDDEYELTLPTCQLDPTWARRMTADGWIATRRHICPSCVRTKGDALLEHLELERTNLTLFDIPIHRPHPAPEAEDPT